MTRRTAPSELLDQPPPADVAAEHSYIGAAIVSRDVLDQHPVDPADFHVAALGRLCDHLHNYPIDGPITAEALVAWLPPADLEAVGGPAGIAAAVQFCGHVAHAGLFARRIRTAAARRRIIHRLCDGLQAAYNGHDDPAALIAEITGGLESIGGSDADDPFRLVDCAALAGATYETRFLVEGLLVAGQPTILAGAQKTLKSLLATDIAVSIATGSDCLGSFRVPTPESVIYMTGEGGLGLSQDYAGRVAEAKGFALGKVPNLVFCDRLPQLGLAADLEHLRRILRSRRPALLILDCAYLCVPGTDAGNVMKMGEVLSGLNRTCLESDVTPLLLHHTKRNLADPSAPAELADIGWAGFSEFASGWLLLSRRERYSPEAAGDHRLWLTAGARVGLSSLWAVDAQEGLRTDPAGRRWEVTIGRAADARADAADRREAERENRHGTALEKHRERLLAVMAKRPGGETASLLRDMAGLRTGEFKVALASLLEDGSAETCEVVRQNRKAPYEGYRIAE